MGDPRGVGAELIVKALATLSRRAHFVIFGHEALLREAAELVGVRWPSGLEIREPVLSVKRQSLRRRCGEASLAYIRDSVMAIRDGECDGLVTAPICKEHIHQAGSPYPGHTEMLAGLAGIKDETFLMMAGPRLRVSLATLHVPLAKVPARLTPARILRVVELTEAALKNSFGIRKPRLAVSGFNPHASEGGLFGQEEACKIIPALQKARRKGIRVEGPLPGDTVFYRAVSGDFDAVISMFHDQGLIPVKLLHFEDAVNMTLGLPFVRTSVGHGTGFDIAWKGVANPASLIAAGTLAAKLVKQNS